MAVCRVERTKNYTVMANYHLDDKRLSLKAKGLLSLMLRLPDDWDYTIGGLTRICQEGKAAIGKAVEELEAAGYIVRHQTHDDSGAFAGNEYVIYECPPGEVSPLAENRSTVPLADIASTENTQTENQTQPSTNIPSTNPPKAPQEGGRREAKSAPAWRPERFARFWTFYPAERRRDKPDAIKEWDKLHPSDELINQMAIALYKQKRSEDWRRGIGIPYPCRWIKNRRWEDPVVEAPDTGQNGGGGWAEDSEVI